ncbi:MAG: TIR domain-containing protein [Synechococcus sp.]
MPDSQFDVFLCHNSRDKPQVKEIGLQLRQMGLRVWLDEWELRPGLPWQPALEDCIEEIGAAAVFVGPDGIGPWQDIEIQAYLREFVRRRCPVIPVILERVGDPPRLPLFLRGHTWVDFRKSEPIPLHQLYYGITGDRTVPEFSQQIDNPAPETVTPSPVVATPVTFAEQASDRQELKKIDLGNGVVLELVSIPGGTFLMGSPKDDRDAHEYESPQHEVIISNF